MQRHLATSEVRAKASPFEKALILLDKPGATKKDVVKAVGISRYALYRAIKAKKNGRGFGINGRPRSLSEDIEQDLAEWCRQRDSERESPTYEDVRRKVGKIYSSSWRGLLNHRRH